MAFWRKLIKREVVRACRLDSVGSVSGEKSKFVQIFAKLPYLGASFHFFRLGNFYVECFFSLPLSDKRTIFLR